MDITSQNQIKVTGRVTFARHGAYGEHPVLTLSLGCMTTFQKINGKFETQTNEFECMLWQRHNKNDISLISTGDIISVTGELKNQAVFTGYNWTRKMMLFVYDFEIIGGKEDKLVPEKTKALTYN
jgi:hypothetical protein